MDEGLTLLDVGVGVGALACAFRDTVPGAQVIGIDPLPRAIDSARKTVAERGLAERIELSCCGVEDFDADGAVDLA